MLLPPPLRPAERSILFSGKSVRLSDDAQSAASSHAPKKGCSLREVWRSQTCTSWSPFFCLLFFGEAKKSKCPAGMKRMVKTTPKSQPQSSNPFSGCLKRQPHKTIVCRLVKRQQTTIALLVAIDFAQTALKTKSPYQTTPYPSPSKYCLTPP